MATFLESLANTAREGLCTYLEAYNNWANWFFDDPFFGNSDITAGARQSLYRFACNREPPPAPDPLVPGGQCVGVGYKWQVQFEWAGNSSDTNWLPETISNFTQPNTNGPIGQLRKVGGAGAWSLRFDSGSGEVTVFSHTSGSPTGFRNFRFTQIYRADGQPDNCGTVPAPVDPADPPTTTTNITYTDVNNTNITIPATFVYAPVNVSLNGNLNIPVSVTLNGELNPSFTLNIDMNTGDVTVNVGENGSGEATKIPDAQYDTPTDTPDTPDDVPDSTTLPPNDDIPDSVSRIRGVIVTVPDNPSGKSVVFQVDNPDIFIPRLGNVQFLCRIGNKQAWTDDIPVRNRRHLIPCPWEGGAIDVRGTPAPGVTWTLTPVWGEYDEAIQFST